MRRARNAQFLGNADHGTAQAVFAQPAQGAEHAREAVGEVVGLHHEEPDDARIFLGHLEARVCAGAQAGNEEAVGRKGRAGQQRHGVLDGSAGLFLVRETAVGEAAVTQARQVESDGGEPLDGRGARQLDVEPMGPHARQHAGVEQDEAGLAAGPGRPVGGLGDGADQARFGPEAEGFFTIGNG